MDESKEAIRKAYIFLRIRFDWGMNMKCTGMLILSMMLAFSVGLVYAQDVADIAALADLNVTNITNLTNAA